MNDLLAETIKQIKDTGIKLTCQQTQILHLITRYNSPLTAHDILIKLKEINPKANRMTIYRSLDYLVKVCIIHKIDFNNTYKLCNQFKNHSCQIFICEVCGIQLEIHSIDIEDVINEVSKKHEFHISNPIQVKGICRDCCLGELINITGSA